MKIVIATTNLHKVLEYRDILKMFKKLDIRSLINYPEHSIPESTAATVQERAREKASHALKALNCLVIADESILVVPALQGAPGIHSKRYAGEDATDAENRKKLLKEMMHLQSHERTAYFECCLIIMTPKGSIKTASVTSYGEIAMEERGRNGFGYDSLFVKQDYDKTYAEMSDGTKNRISHRSKAVEKLMPFLEQVHEHAQSPCSI